MTQGPKKQKTTVVTESRSHVGLKTANIRLSRSSHYLLQNKANAEHKTAWEPRTSVANKVREKLLPTVISFKKARHFIFGKCDF